MKVPIEDLSGDVVFDYLSAQTKEPYKVVGGYIEDFKTIKSPTHPRKIIHMHVEDQNKRMTTLKYNYLKVLRKIKSMIGQMDIEEYLAEVKKQSESKPQPEASHEPRD